MRSVRSIPSLCTDKRAEQKFPNRAAARLGRDENIGSDKVERERFSSEYMKMQMVYALSGIVTHVRYDAVAAGEPRTCRNTRNQLENF